MMPSPTAANAATSSSSSSHPRAGLWLIALSVSAALATATALYFHHVSAPAPAPPAPMAVPSSTRKAAVSAACANSNSKKIVESSASPSLSSRAAAIPSAVSSSSAARHWLQAAPCHSASASGKALVTGGYLVLEPQFSGLVFSLSARFHARLTSLPLEPAFLAALHSLSGAPLIMERLQGTRDALALMATQPSIATERKISLLAAPIAESLRFHALLLVHAPQRSAAVSECWVSFDLPFTHDHRLPLPTESVTRVSFKPSEAHNPFIASSIYVALHFLSSLLPLRALTQALERPILLELMADHAFYAADSSSDDKRHFPLPPDAKTGLGSSAALVSSLVAVIFQRLALFDTDAKTIAWLPMPPQRTSMESSFAVINSSDLSTSSSRANWSRSHVPLQLSTADWFACCHHVAQLAHCAAQGKVGSGFDVATAFFGSSSYRRFHPEAIRGLLDETLEQCLERSELIKHMLPVTSHEQHAGAAIEGMSVQMTRSLSPPSPAEFDDLHQLCPWCHWLEERQPFDYECRTVRLPSFLLLSLADVQGGAKTPALVATVLNWRKNNKRESDSLWNRVHELNALIEQDMRSLDALEANWAQSATDASSAQALLKLLASTPSSTWAAEHQNFTTSPLFSALLRLSISLASVRELYQHMGQLSGADIEPTSQGHLCDDILREKGVLACGVPGAGGEDAIFVFSIVHSQVPTTWQQCLPTHVRVLPVRQLDQPMKPINTTHDFTRASDQLLSV